MGARIMVGLASAGGVRELVLAGVPSAAGEEAVGMVRSTTDVAARFMLAAAMNPCPCGYYGTDMCRCKDADVKRYQKKISGPILDRIDLQVKLAR